MASSNDKLESDAKRMGSRGPGGYLVDRVVGRADFSKNGSVEASAGALGTSRSRRKGVTEEAYAKGGTVKAPSTAAIRAYSKEYDTITPAGKNVHEKASKRRGYGAARGA